MQIEIRTPNARGVGRPWARVWSAVMAIALVLLAAGTARAVADAPPVAGFDRSAPRLQQTGASMPLTMPAGAPGDTEVSTTTISLQGSDPAAVRLSAEATGELAPFLHVTIVRGSGEGTGWVADPGAPLFEGTLAALPADWTSGLRDGTWQAGERHTYRISVTLTNDQRAQGLTASATFRWESRSI